MLNDESTVGAIDIIDTAVCNDVRDVAVARDTVCDKVDEITRPDRTPYPPIDENIDLLQKWLLDTFSKSTFNVSAKPLPTMSGPPLHIHLAKDAIEYRAHTPVPVPHYYKEEVNRQLADDVRRGIIVKVPFGVADGWCQRMLVLPKRNGEPRRVVDFQPLNKFVKRETHLSPTQFEAVSSIPPCMYKSKSDAMISSGATG